MSTIIQKTLSYFYAPYENADIRIQKKARLLAPLTLSIAALCVLLSMVMGVTAAYAVAGILSGFIVLCVAVLVLLRKGAYAISSSLFLYGLFLAMFAAIKFDAYKNIYETYVFASLGLFFMLMVANLGAHYLHALAATIGTLAGIAALYVLDSLPGEGGTVSLLAIQNLATCGVITVAGGALCAAAIKMQNNLVRETLTSATKARTQADEFGNVVSSACESIMKIGSELAEASETLSSAITQFRITVQEETSGLETLDDVLLQNEGDERKGIEAQARVRNSLAAYSGRVERVASSVARMIESIGAIAQNAGERKAAVDRLTEMAKDGSVKSKDLSRTIESIVTATARMDEVNSLIGDVASRTNLLGMNASIEAAHAGSAGKGFAVVAQEIRKLSQQAESGSQTIAQTLAATRSAVDGAAKASGETGSFINEMDQEIEQVADTLSGLIERLQEVARGTGEIRSAMEDFSGLAAETGKEAASTEDLLKKVIDMSDVSREVASNMKTDAKSMMKACDALLDKAARVRDLGKQNISKMQELQNSVCGIASRHS
ncbi:hypothetical protein K7J14_14310 [Treponema zuelzerae]|uniref:Methyl-accepting transducer domain-containing protein n=1 Tax=Teretinema zuelzerae TaxID=156 RepID=A0AAE3ELX0_9SPIR|nr:methyl-accepting chemotaxis protein [Teretinema zuelzerae]MCD1655868.1 hypothetical protein [Teretinema zuelzerae]